MAPARAMTDEQRRAMFARMNGGRGGSGSTPYVYDGAGDTETSAWKGFWKGFNEGVIGAGHIGLNNFLLGMGDKLGISEANKYLESGETVWQVSDLLSKIGMTAAWTATGAGSLSKLAGSLREAASFGVRGAGIGLRAAEAAQASIEGWGAKRARDEIEEFRGNSKLPKILDKGLWAIGEAVDFWGGHRTSPFSRGRYF